MSDIVTNLFIYIATVFGGIEAAFLVLLVIIGIWAALNRASLPTLVFVFFLLLGSAIALSQYIVILYGLCIVLASGILFFGLRAQQSGGY
jgi:hypothetical protein